MEITNAWKELTRISLIQLPGKELDGNLIRNINH